MKFLIPLLSLISISFALFEDTTPPIEISGNKFFYSNNGSQFLMRGIAYQEETAQAVNSALGYKDPLANITECQRDIRYFRETNTNCLRVYAIDPTADHEECMQAMSEAGIYIIADLSEPTVSINRNNPEWNLDLFDRYKAVVDDLQQYSNVLGFFAGNEVTNNRSNTDASPFVKAAVRDIKKYIEDQDYRQIPVGYSSNDDEDTRIAIANYFACGSVEDRADFFGINMYEWCGESTFRVSGYADRTEEFSNLTIPIFFSEYGCNINRPRLFQEVGTLYSDDMTDIWSGGIVYMYWEEANEYGLVELNSNGEIVTNDDYDNYRSEINNISPNYATRSEVETTTLTCPGSSESTWRAAVDLPPTPDEAYCECHSRSFDCVVNEDLEAEDYGELYGLVCAEIDCSDISVDGTTGDYGDYSFCSDRDKLSYVLNLYFHDQGGRVDACDFDGKASLNADAQSSSSCGLGSSRQAAATRTVNQIK
ncbi:unnamed protein product [Candida verbasci]|uniref:1,3-beta-glucanosyltransferase n=1 Tax=Candida verbasci TaxID=1227364 RepID=A0A9W4XB57_9ASCO|nr:unnamed protein product [Candida verbasci]